MKQLFDFHAIDMFPYAEGFVVVEKHDDEERKHINYKYFPLTPPSVTKPISIQSFLNAKFRDNYASLESLVDNYLLEKALWLNDREIMLVSPIDGSAKIISDNGTLLWQGFMLYRDEAPSGLEVKKDKIWASYEGGNTLVRYSLKTIREELRVGGPDDSVFDKPNGIWIEPLTNNMYVCNSGSQSVVKLELDTFRVETCCTFEEPIRKYYIAGSRQYVLLDSGIYVI